VGFLEDPATAGAPAAEAEAQAPEDSALGSLGIGSVRAVAS